MLAGLFIGGLAVLNSAAELGISHVLVIATIMSWLLNKESTFCNFECWAVVTCL